MSKADEDAVQAFDVDAVLAASVPGRDYSDALKKVAQYLSAAAECIDPYPEIVVDPQHLLVRFEEVLLVTMRMLKEVSPDYEERVRGIDEKLNLSQNVVMLGSIALPARPAVTPSLARAFHRVLRGSILRTLPITLPEQEPQPISTRTLLEIKTALNRCAGLVKAAVPMASRWYQWGEEEVIVSGIYDPGRVRKDEVRSAIAALKNAVETAPDMPQHAKEVVLRQLLHAGLEVDRSEPPWSKIMGRLVNVMMVLAATITVLGGVDDASQDLKAAFETVSRVVESIRDQASGVWIPPNQLPKSLLSGTPQSPFVKSEADYEIDEE